MYGMLSVTSVRCPMAKSTVLARDNFVRLAIEHADLAVRHHTEMMQIDPKFAHRETLRIERNREAGRAMECYKLAIQAAEREGVEYLVHDALREPIMGRRVHRWL